MPQLQQQQFQILHNVNKRQHIPNFTQILEIVWGLNEQVRTDG